MLLDKELELFNEQAITSSAVTSDAKYLGKTKAARACTLVVTGHDLAGGTAIQIELITSSTSAFSSSATIGSWAVDLTASPMLQVQIPYTVKEYVKVKATPTGTFTAGKISADIAYGPELAAV